MQTSSSHVTLSHFVQASNTRRRHSTTTLPNPAFRWSFYDILVLDVATLAMTTRKTTFILKFERQRRGLNNETWKGYQAAIRELDLVTSSIDHRHLSSILTSPPPFSYHEGLVDATPQVSPHGEAMTAAIGRLIRNFVQRELGSKITEDVMSGLGAYRWKHSTSEASCWKITLPTSSLLHLPDLNLNLFLVLHHSDRLSPISHTLSHTLSVSHKRKFLRSKQTLNSSRFMRRLIMERCECSSSCRSVSTSPRTLLPFTLRHSPPQPSLTLPSSTFVNLWAFYLGRPPSRLPFPASFVLAVYLSPLQTESRTRKKGWRVDQLGVGCISDIDLRLWSMPLPLEGSPMPDYQNRLDEKPENGKFVDVPAFGLRKGLKERWKRVTEDRFATCGFGI
ncbi:hypothetical protein FB446DRAFT_746569 [Lentinula raphanica]|nr:hypothetical protein FB446DRAFT_746569 [Lentinula raphanica]